MASPAPLPPWLRNTGGRSQRANIADTVGKIAAAAVLLAIGGVAGYLLHGPKPEAPAAPAPVAACPTCPAPMVCPDVLHRRAAAPARRSEPHKTKATVAAASKLQPLPAAPVMDDSARTQALRAFAEEKAPELRDCLAAPDRGPPKNVGAALEIDAKGSVDSVQILGSDGTPATVQTCYRKRLKKWRFPEELLRGEEKLLVNFVL